MVLTWGSKALGVMPGCRPGFCLCMSFNWIHECMGSCICVYVLVIKLMRSCEYVLSCMYWHSAETSRMALPYTCMESSFLPLLLPGHSKPT